MSGSARDEEVLRRRAAACVALAEQGADALVTDRPESVHYLTGYSVGQGGSSNGRPIIAVLFPTGELLVIAATQQGESIGRDIPDVVTDVYGPPVPVPSEWVLPDGKVQFAPAAFERLRAAVTRPGVETVAVDGLGAAFPPTTRLDAALSGTKAVDGSELIWQLRRRKSDWELDRLREAADALEAAFGSLLPQLRPGMSEREIQRRLAIAILETGAGVSFASVLVAEDGREIFGRATDRHWERGDALYVDAGALVDGYASDFCRMYVAGAPSAEQTAAYQRVVDARDAALAGFQPGYSAGELASQMVRLLGSPEQVAGRYGHGLGFRIEPPSLTPADPTVLEDGTVFCLEPALLAGGTYYALEEEYVVQQGQLVRLSPLAPRELIVVS
jgi:Xaa-Pro aminopeptidase